METQNKVDSAELSELKEKLAAAEKEKNEALTLLNKANGRGLMLKEENMMLTASPEIQAKMAELNYHMAVAQKMIASKAFPAMTPEQAYVVIKAGLEMGLSEMQAMSSLYIVNGQIGFHSKGLSGRLTQFGYKIKFTNESDQGVTVTITKDADGFSESEVVKRSDKVFEKSKAITFAPKNKMRFHGIRQIANFHLAHLFGSAQIWDEDDTGKGGGDEYTNLEDLKELYELKKESIEPNEQINIERIFKNNEVKSFPKLKKYLMAL
jgi:hypothetical protein